LDYITEGLNQSQKEAVKHINGPLIVIAGAGSGKTKVLTSRIAYLISQGIQPDNILALTFTNKAAREMKNRIATIVDERVAYRVIAGTFHSTFARILRTEAESLGYNSNFSIYDADDSLSLIRSVMNTIGISQQQYPAQGMRSRISFAKNQMIAWEQYAESAATLVDKFTGQVYEQYTKELKKNNSMDFDDLLINVIKMLQQFPDLLKKYQEKFRYILVDEYQDTNRAQYLVLNMLSKAHRNICVVGDDAQSIYKWRGADINNIFDFQRDNPNSKMVRLEQNYRSTKTILAAADCVIKNNSRQIEKVLWTENPQGELIDLIACQDDREESFKAINMVKKLQNTGLELKDIAILYRTNAQSQLLENALRSSNIPYIIVGGMSFYQRKEIKDTLAYLRMLVNPFDSESLLRIINEPPRGLGKTSLEHIKNYAISQEIPLFEAFQSVDFISTLKPQAIRGAKSFVDIIINYTTLVDEMDTDELARKFIEETGMPNMYKEINTDESLDRLNNIEQLLNDITRFTENDENNHLIDYLQQISLITDLDSKDLSQNAVTLMTLHSAKGLEFPGVIITGLEQGLFPLVKPFSDKEEEEEERRLFYVGITRAKQKLYLLYALKRLRFGEYNYQTPSRFIREINADLIKSNLPSFAPKSPAVSKPKKFGYTSDAVYFDDLSSGNQSYSQVPESSSAVSFSRGDKVTHKQFGHGVIVSITGENPNKRALHQLDAKC